MKLLMVPREKIKVGGYRIRFQSGVVDIEDLAHSIEQHGLLCPVVVTKEGDEYSLIAGERRLSAMDKLGWEKIPAIDNESGGGADVLIKGLVENMIRRDLSPLERALAIEEIIEDYGYTQERLAEELDIGRSTISNHLRMLDTLHPRVLKYVHQGKITFGHAKVLMRLEDQKKQLEIADRVVADGLTIMQTALLVDQARPPEDLTEREKNLNLMENEIKEAVGDKWWEGITIKQGKKKEQLRIDFTQRGELKKILYKIAAAL